MWGALENMAIRHTLPAPLAQGDSVNSILVSGQLAGGRHMLRFLGYRRNVPYVLRQFYSVNAQAFLRWQNEARFCLPAPHPDFLWPCEEWSGGLIYPLPSGRALNAWLADDPSPVERVRAGLRLARLLERLHREGMVHRGLNPGCVFVGDARVSLAGFGQARRCGWDDLWADSPLGARSPAFDAVERLCGEDSGPAQDVYSFGALLHLLTLGVPPFGAVRARLRRWVPRWLPPGDFPDETDYPDRVALLVRACLCPSSADRPTMAEAAEVLVNCVEDAHGPDSRESVAGCFVGDESGPAGATHHDDTGVDRGAGVAKGAGGVAGGQSGMDSGKFVDGDSQPAGAIHHDDSGVVRGADGAGEDLSGVDSGRVESGPRHGRGTGSAPATATGPGEHTQEGRGPTPAERPAHVLVFVKGDELTPLMTDRVLAMAERENCAFLFVSLVPLNLPSGREQLFRGELYRRLGAGLARCRRAGLLWGLRVFDNVDPERTAQELIRRYRPDLVLLGRCDEAGPLTLRQGFCRCVTDMGVQVRACD